MGVFFDDLLIPNAKYLISGPSIGSEQDGLVVGASMDDQIIRDLFRNLGVAGWVLTLDKELSNLCW